jgi:hypothetical protein
VQQRRRHGRIHAARETEEHAAFADLLADVGDGLRDKVLRRPILFRAADADEEVADHVHTALGVENLRVKLDAVEPALLVLNSGERRVIRHRRRDETGGQFLKLVAVGIPDAELLRQAGEELARFLDREVTVAVFACLAVRDVTAEVVPHELDAVADAEHGHAELENLRIRMRRRLRVNTLRTAREDDAHDTVFTELRRRGRCSDRSSSRLGTRGCGAR